MGIMEILENQNIIPELLGTIPREVAAAEDEPECGEYFKDFYANEYGQNENYIANTLIFLFDRSFMRYVHSMEAAIEDAMDLIRYQEEVIARSGNAYLMQDADRGARAHGDLVKELELTRAQRDGYKMRFELTNELYEQTKELLFATTKENVGVNNKVTELNAEKYNTRGHMAKKEGQADVMSTNEPVKAIVTDDKGKLVDVVEVPYSNRFASADGISGKAKQKMIIVGVTALGWGYEEIEKRFNLKQSTIKTYYIEGKKALPKASKLTHIIEGLPLLPWSDNMSDDKVPYNYFSTAEQRLIYDYCTNNTYFAPPEYISA